MQFSAKNYAKNRPATSQPPRLVPHSEKSWIHHRTMLSSEAFLRDNKKSATKFYLQTRMHSSRMRTVRCSSRMPGGCLPRGAKVYPSGCLPMGCLPTGVSASGGGGCTPPLPPWTEFLTHGCENITFPQLRLRTVKSNSNWYIEYWWLNDTVLTFVFRDWLETELTEESLLRRGIMSVSPRDFSRFHGIIDRKTLRLSTALTVSLIKHFIGQWSWYDELIQSLCRSASPWMLLLFA